MNKVIITLLLLLLNLLNDILDLILLLVHKVLLFFLNIRDKTPELVLFISQFVVLRLNGFASNSDILELVH